VKIGALLALGFGVGGARIVHDYTNENSDINLNLPGSLKYCFYGFCDIRQFTVISECLQERIINYVNTIAEIVHGTVDQYSGEPNRNIGDAFLIIWQLPMYEWENLTSEELKIKHRN